MQSQANLCNFFCFTEHSRQLRGSFSFFILSNYYGSRFFAFVGISQFVARHRWYEALHCAGPTNETKIILIVFT